MVSCLRLWPGIHHGMTVEMMGHSCALQAHLDSSRAFIHQGRASAGEQARHRESGLHGGALHPSGRRALLSRQDCEPLLSLSLKQSHCWQCSTQGCTALPAHSSI